MIEIEADYTNRIEKIKSIFTAEPCTLERGTYTEWQWVGTVAIISQHSR